MFQVRITETTAYTKKYARAALIGFLIGHNTLPGDLTDAELAALTDAELADMAEDDRPDAIEEDVQSEGDVQGSVWEVSVVPD